MIKLMGAQGYALGMRHTSTMASGREHTAKKILARGNQGACIKFGKHICRRAIWHAETYQS